MTRKPASFCLGLSLLLLALTSSCTTPYIRRDETPAAEQAKRDAIVACARSLLGQTDLASMGAPFRNDCTGFVNGVYSSCGYPVTLEGTAKKSLSHLMFLNLRQRHLAHFEGVPLPADVVFFQNTTESGFDRISHAALVEEVHDDGTVVMIHYGSGKVGRFRMNLRHPYRQKDADGTVLNDYLRADPYGSGRKEYLAGALFAAYGDLLMFAEREQ